MIRAGRGRRGKGDRHTFPGMVLQHCLSLFVVLIDGVVSWIIKKTECWKINAFKYGAGENSWESFGLQGDQISQSERKYTMNTHWKDWYWSCNSNTLATWCAELTHWKSPFCWERLKVGGEEDDRGWDGWIASPTQWTWVRASSGRQWRTEEPGVLQSMGS